MELPEGPGGNGTMQFTNAWGMAADSKNKDDALARAALALTPILPGRAALSPVLGAAAAAGTPCPAGCSWLRPCS